MKNLILFFIFLFFIILTSNSQEISNHAVGIRFGNNAGLGSEISYQRKLLEINRIEIDLGYRNQRDYNAFKLTGIYQWVWNLDGGFNWYAGFGAGIGSWSYNKNVIPSGNDGIFINADGNVGIEYNFEIPILISLDFRPEMGVIGNYSDDTAIDLSLSIRYQFN